MEEQLATEKQKQFAKKLGLEMGENTTLKDASKMIDEALKKQKETQEKHDMTVADTMSVSIPIIPKDAVKTEVKAEIKPQTPKQPSAQTPKPYVKPAYSKPFYNSGKQASIEKMHEEKTKRMVEEERLKIRSMAVSFSKDLVVAGKLDYNLMENEAQKIIDFINKKESVK